MNSGSHSEGQDCCEACRDFFDGREDDKKLADAIEAKHPKCECEQHRVGPNSPGPVADDETLHRLVISPRDIDEDGNLTLPPFQKIAENGFSVCRSIATDADVEALVVDMLWRKSDQDTKEVRAVLSAPTASVRAETEKLRYYCVYDQTVPRRVGQEPAVPTHAGVFLREPPPKTPDRKKLQKDFAVTLRTIFRGGGTLGADLFRNGILTALNARSRNGEFELPSNS